MGPARGDAVLPHHHKAPTPADEAIVTVSVRPSLTSQADRPGRVL